MSTSKPKITVYLSAELASALQGAVEASGLSLSQEVEAVLRESYGLGPAPGRKPRAKKGDNK
jgi:hypothetical protein